MRLTSVDTNPIPGDLPFCRFHLQPKLKTPLSVAQELLKAVIRWSLMIYMIVVGTNIVGSKIFRAVDHQEQGWWPPAYRKEVQNLVKWCSENNLVLSTTKTKEIIADFRMTWRATHSALYMHWDKMERVESFKLLGIHILEVLTWGLNSSHLGHLHMHSTYLPVWNTYYKNYWPTSTAAASKVSVPIVQQCANFPAHLHQPTTKESS